MGFFPAFLSAKTVIWLKTRRQIEFPWRICDCFQEAKPSIERSMVLGLIPSSRVVEMMFCLKNVIIWSLIVGADLGAVSMEGLGWG